MEVSPTNTTSGGNNDQKDISPTSSTSSSVLITKQILRPPSKTVGTGINTLQYQSISPAWQCTFSKNGDWLAACYGAPDPCIRIWKKGSTISGNDNSRNKKNTNSGNNAEEEWILNATLEDVHTRTIRSVAFAPIQSPLIFAAASFDHTVSIWEYVDKMNEWECVSSLFVVQTFVSL